MNYSRRKGIEFVMAGLFSLAALMIVSVFLWIVGDIVRHGFNQISWNYLTTSPERAGRSGGIASILTGTFLLLVVSLAASVPLGVASAVYLSDYASPSDRMARLVRRSLDVLAGVPSIVFGLFGYLVFCQALHMGWSILSGGLTLACMILPMVVRATEEGLRAVPGHYRLGPAALGISKGAMLWRILLPSAMPGLRVGLVLGIGRALAETAAVMFTAGGSIRMPQSVMDPVRSLAYHIYILAIEIPGGQNRAYAASLILVLLLLTIHMISNAMMQGYVRKRIYLP